MALVNSPPPPSISSTDATAPDRWTALVVIAGIAALLLRYPALLLGAEGSTWASAALMSAILVSCLAVNASGEKARLSAPMTLVVGIAIVLVASVAAGTPPPLKPGLTGIAMSMLAAVAEEALFRRAAYGWLSRWGAPVAIFATALIFAAIHYPFYGPAVLPVDLGAGLLFSWQRWACGDWKVPATTHAAANALVLLTRW